MRPTGLGESATAAHALYKCDRLFNIRRYKMNLADFQQHERNHINGVVSAFMDGFISV